MGHTIWVDVSGRSKDDVPPDNSIMLRLEKELDALSNKLNVACLSEFFDYSVLEEEYAEFLEEESESEEEQEPESTKPKGKWFDPARALAAVKTIREHLKAKPADINFEFKKSQEHWPEALMQELQHCETVLQAAVLEGKQFRFLLVP